MDKNRTRQRDYERGKFIALMQGINAEAMPKSVIRDIGRDARQNVNSLRSMGYTGDDGYESRKATRAEVLKIERDLQEKIRNATYSLVNREGDMLSYGQLAGIHKVSAAFSSDNIFEWLENAGAVEYNISAGWWVGTDGVRRVIGSYEEF